MPKISIITPCYNSAPFVARTIESIRSQTFQDWEHVVVDDGSADASAEVIESCLARDSRLKLVRQPNGGVCQARNRGFAACSPDTQYICFLDADDCPEPDMLATLAAYLDKHSETGLAYCDYRYVDSGDAPLPTPYHARCVPAGLGLRKLPRAEALTPFISVFCGAPVLPSASLIRRSVYEQSPGWDEKFGQHHEELDLFLNFALLSEIHFVPQTLLRYRQHAAQSTKNPALFGVQQKKLDAKWNSKSGLTAEQQSVVEAAKAFRDGRMTPYAGLLAGTRHLRRREPAQAARFYLGAVRRYVRGCFAGPVVPHSAERNDAATGAASNKSAV